MIVVSLIGYLFGNIQAAYILTKYIKKVDIRSYGHGNAGASNVAESFGMKFGFIVVVIDILKAVLSIILVKQLYSITMQSNPTLLYLNGFGVIIGHIFPFFMHFKGGKGTASLIGVLLGLDIYLGLAGIFVIVAATILTDRVALGTFCLTLFWAILTIYFRLGWMPISVSLLMFILSFKLHLPNYRRIMNNTEGRLSTVLKKNKK